MRVATNVSVLVAVMARAAVSITAVVMTLVTVEPDAKAVVESDGVRSVLKFPLMKPTKTAAYAAIDANTSCLRAFVNIARERAKPTVRPLSIPNLAFGLLTQCKPRTAPSRKTIARIPLMIEKAIVARLLDTKSESPSVVLVYLHASAIPAPSPVPRDLSYVGMKICRVPLSGQRVGLGRKALHFLLSKIRLITYISKTLIIECEHILRYVFSTSRILHARCNPPRAAT